VQVFCIEPFDRLKPAHHSLNDHVPDKPTCALSALNWALGATPRGQLASARYANAIRPSSDSCKARHPSGSVLTWG
jgi:hypothetical protein